MSGMDRITGKTLSGWAHVVQSIGVILTTPKVARVMRRAFGAGLPRRVDSPISPTSLIDFYADTAAALRTQEPRFRPSRVALAATPDGGEMQILVEGVYFPRGHLGDFSVSEPQIAAVAL